MFGRGLVRELQNVPRVGLPEVLLRTRLEVRFWEVNRSPVPSSSYQGCMLLAWLLNHAVDLDSWCR